MLLPQQERFAFAHRRDLARNDQIDNASQSNHAKLGWVIDDSAIVRVNKHIQCFDTDSTEPAVFICDELGWLEIERNQGFTAALVCLDRGPTSLVPHALVVVRPELVDVATERFGAVWPHQMCIAADDQSADLILDTLCSKK